MYCVISIQWCIILCVMLMVLEMHHVMLCCWCAMLCYSGDVPCYVVLLLCNLIWSMRITMLCGAIGMHYYVSMSVLKDMWCCLCVMLCGSGDAPCNVVLVMCWLIIQTCSVSIQYNTPHHVVSCLLAAICWVILTCSVSSSTAHHMSV